MEDWLTLTEEDIARAHRLTRDHPLLPNIIILTDDDVANTLEETEQPTVTSQPSANSQAVAAPVSPRTPSPSLTITMEDLTPTPPQVSVSDKIRGWEGLMFNLVKAARSENMPASFLGTANLKWDDALAAIARGHSADMLRRQYVAHVTPEGITADQRLQINGVNYVASGENIGIVYGQASHGGQGVHEIHNAFMDQPRSLTNHRGNLLNPLWTHCGIGIAYSDSGSMVATQLFISSPAAHLRGK